MTEMGVRPWAITTNNEVALLFTLLFTMALVYHIVHLIFFQQRGTVITLSFPKLSSAYSYYGITGPKTIVVPRHYRHIGLRRPCSRLSNSNMGRDSGSNIGLSDALVRDVADLRQHDWRSLHLQKHCGHSTNCGQCYWWTAQETSGLCGWKRTF